MVKENMVAFSERWLLRQSPIFSQSLTASKHVDFSNWRYFKKTTFVKNEKNNIGKVGIVKEFEKGRK